MIMYLLDKQQNIIKAISDGIIEAKMTEEINTADKLSFSLVQNQRLTSNIYFVCIPATRGDAFLMFKIISESVKDDHIEYTCIESAYDELKSYAYIKDVRPQDKTASEMLRIALDGTRWEVEYSEETVRKRTNFYYISTLEAIQKVVELFKIELTFTVVINPITNRIVRRQVNLYSQQGERTGKRFEYGSNLLSVTREESSEDLVTALVGRGKGEQLDDGNDDTVDGYGRRIMFTDVVWSKAKGNPTDKPAGQEYVEDKEATKLYGFDDGKPRIGIAVFEDIEDVNQLINATWSALQVAKRPKVSFKASALDVGDLGLGDTVVIIRHELGIEYFTRVYKVEHDLLDKNNNVIELGDDFSEKSLTNYVASVKEAQEETSRVANIALTSANGKNKNFYSNVKPKIAAEGDNLFLDLGNGGTEYYIYKNGNWELILSTQETAETKKAVDQALADLEDVREKANSAYSNADALYGTVAGMSSTIAEIETQSKQGVQQALEQAQKVSNDFLNYVNGFNSELSSLNDATRKNTTDLNKLVADVIGVRGLYTDLDGRVTRFSAGVDGLSAQLKDTSNQLASVKLTADGTNAKFTNQQNEIANLKTRAGSIEQQMLAKVDSNLFESFKSSTAQELKEKLTATDLNGYVKTTELTRTADGLHASITAVDGKLNSLSFGGRNLLKQSQLGAKFPHDAWYEAFGGVTWNDDTVELNVGNKDCVQIEQRVYDIEPNTDYVFSFDLNWADGQHLDKQGFIFWEFKDRDCKQTTSVYKDNWNIANMSNFPNTPGRADKKLVIHTQPDTHAIIFMVRSLKGATGPFRISKVKFEKGNVATDYTTAPEDQIQQFAAFDTTLKTYRNDLDILKDGMSFRVSEIAQINNKIAELGIQNLVYNSEFINNAEGWSNIGDNPAGTILFANNEWDSWKGANGLAFRETTPPNRYLISNSRNFKVLSGQKLSASVQMHVTDTITNGNNKAGLEIWFFDVNGNNISHSYQPSQYVDNFRNGHQQLLYCDDVVVPNNAKQAYLRLFVFGVANVIFNQPMVTFSSTHLPYTHDAQMIGSLQDKYAALDVKVNGINSTVVNKADLSYVDQRANQLQLALTSLSVGGTNLLGGTSTEARSNEAPTSGWIEGAVYNTTQPLNENQYILSFEAKGDVSGQRIGTFLWHGGLGGRNISKKSSTSLGENFTASDGQTFVTLTNQWKKYWVLYDVDSDNTKKTAIVGRRWVDSRPSGKVYVRKVKLEVGNKATDWSPAPEDTLVAITAVRNELDAAINLRVQKGDVLSQLNLEAGRTLIQTNKLYLDAETVTFSGNAFIPSAAITDLTADKIKTGTLNAGNVNVINLNANNITSGNIDGRRVGVIGQSASMILNGNDGITFRGNDGSWETKFGRNSLSFMNSVNGVNEYVGNISYVHNTNSPNINGFGAYITSKQRLGAPYGGDEFSIGYAASLNSYNADMTYNATGQGKAQGFHWYAPSYLHGNAKITYIDGAHDPLLWTSSSWGNSTQANMGQPTLQLGYNWNTKGDSGVSFLWNSIKPFGTVDMTGTNIRVNGAEDVLQFSWASWSDWTGKIPCLRRPTGGGGIGFGSDGNAILFGGGRRKSLFQM